MVITKTNADLKPVLMDPKGKGNKEPYFIIKNDGQSIFIISPGQNGLEFNKTEGFFSSFLGIQSYQCLYGQGILIMQRNDEQKEAKEFKIITLNFGKQVTVPAGWGMCLVNVGKNFLVVLGNIDTDSKTLDSKPIIEKQGFAYYVVEKKGEIAFEQNPRYHVHPQIATE